MRCVEDGVDRDGQFDDTQRSAQVAAGDGHRVDGFDSQLIGQLPQLLRGEVAEVRGFRTRSSNGVLTGLM